MDTFLEFSIKHIKNSIKTLVSLLMLAMLINCFAPTFITTYSTIMSYGIKLSLIGFVITFIVTSILAIIGFLNLSKNATNPYGRYKCLNQLYSPMYNLVFLSYLICFYMTYVLVVNLQ